MTTLDIVEARHAAPEVFSGPACKASSPTLMLRECLTFRLGAEECGIDILRVQEIRGYEQPTRIANAPAFVMGVLNLRGVIVPVVDLRLKFGLEDLAYDTITVTAVLNVAGRTVGAVVDAVSDVVELTPNQVKPAPDFNSTICSRHVIGIGAMTQGDRDRMLILLDIEALMSSASMGLIEPTLQ